MPGLTDYTVNDAINVTNGDYNWAGLETGLWRLSRASRCERWDQTPGSGTHDDKVSEIPDMRFPTIPGTSFLRDTFTFDSVVAPLAPSSRPSNLK